MWAHRRDLVLIERIVEQYSADVSSLVTMCSVDNSNASPLRA